MQKFQMTILATFSKTMRISKTYVSLYIQLSNAYMMAITGSVDRIQRDKDRIADMGRGGAQ